MQTFRDRFSSFTYLNITQFTGALNDNIYKLLVVYWLIGIEGIQASSRILSMTGAIFVLPFLLISAASGTLADRVSKRNVIVSMKIFELIIMGLGVAAFAFGNRIAAYGILFLMATQSAIFAPSKYGILPEIVKTEKISQANGLLTSFTFLAIILGTFLASFITEITARNFIVGGILCTFIAIFGLGTSFCIEYTPPAGSEKKMNWFFLREIFLTLKKSCTIPSLFPAIVGSSFFLFLGSFVQLNIIPYAVHTLHLTDVQGGYLFLLTALGIGTGSVTAGKISGKTVELGLVPFGGLGVVLCCYLLDWFSSSFFLVLPSIVMCGFFGGLYQVPLDSYIQVASPSQERGQIIAAGNFLSFFGVLLSSGFLYLLSVILEIQPDTAFGILGIVTLFVTLFFAYQFFDYIARFVGMILAKLHFSTTIKGEEFLSSEPTLYLCHYTALHDTLLLLGAQKRRMRFFLQSKGVSHRLRWIEWLYGLLRFAFLPEITPFSREEEVFREIEQSLERGISVCLFVDIEDLDEAASSLRQASFFQELFSRKENVILKVSILKGEKSHSARLLRKWDQHLRVPTLLAFTPYKENAV